jgi:hypothetical protein
VDGLLKLEKRCFGAHKSGFVVNAEAPFAATLRLL